MNQYVTGAVINCHGILLSPCQAEENMIFIERVEDEYYVRIEHEMTKHHYISFEAEKILFYCNRDGLFG